MTIRELYEWADENEALDCDIRILDRDGGYFTGGSTRLEGKDPTVEDGEVFL